MVMGIALCAPAVRFVMQLHLQRMRLLRPRPRLVVVDGNGPIIGKPGRAQWRLRRRALLEAHALCESVAREQKFEVAGLAACQCADRIQDRVEELDRESPEFSGMSVLEGEHVA